MSEKNGTNGAAVRVYATAEEARANRPAGHGLLHRLHARHAPPRQ
jgi:hypothetical protein